MIWFDPTLVQESWVWSTFDRPLKTWFDLIQLSLKKVEFDRPLIGFFFDRAGSSLIEVRSGLLIEDPIFGSLTVTHTIFLQNRQYYRKVRNNKKTHFAKPHILKYFYQNQFVRLVRETVFLFSDVMKIFFHHKYEFLCFLQIHILVYWWAKSQNSTFCFS